MSAMRVPAEPVAVLCAAFPDEPRRRPLYRPWVEHLRRRLRRAGLAAADQVFGIAWSGGMTEGRVLRLLPHLPEGVSEIYFHPAASGSTRLAAPTPGYRYADELAALVSPDIARRVAELGIALKGYRELPPPRSSPE
jgi:hypothetical protein